LTKAKNKLSWLSMEEVPSLSFLLFILLQFEWKGGGSHN
jgi:hypothetical protein